MAGVARLSSGRIVQKYFCGFTSQAVRRNYKLRQRICFHTSPFLNVLGQEIKMPSLSPTMTEGTIVQWLKKEGETVAPGDVLCEIQTDKAVMAFETEEEGVLAKILVDTGTKDIKVGTLIALMVADGEDWKAVEHPGAAGGGDSSANASSGGGDAASQGGSSSGPASGGTVPGQPVKMPALSPTMTEGTIVAWKKKEGEKINPGDALCEIQTDKAVMTFETEEEGILAKILVPEGTANVQVGSLIAITVEEGSDWQQVQIPSDAGVSAPAAGVAAPTPAPSTPAFTGGSVPGTQVNMPSLSPTMTEGQIVNWVKKEGDKINPGDVLCEIQTDKAVMSFETEEEGILAKILSPAGSGPIKVGSIIALTVEEGQDWKDVAIPVVEAPQAAAVPAAAAAPRAPTATPAAVPSGYHLVGDFAPAVRALLERYQLSGKEITPTGRNKRILKGDVIKYVSEHNLQPKPPVAVPLPGQKPGAPPSPAPAAAMVSPAGAVPGRVPTGYTDVEISTMRRTIAKRLTQSKQEIPHAYSTLKAEINNLLLIRKQLQGMGIKVSVNDFIVKAVANALKQCPFANTLYVKDQITPSPTIDISIAVATPNGLITPIVKNADQKDIDVISSEIRQLAAKARDGKLQLHEFQGGSFTISNLGMFGIREFSAIINPPQCGILAVGGGQQFVKPDGSAATVMSATLSYDARAMSEDEVAAFMEALTGYLENPASLLLTNKMTRITSKAVTLDLL